MNHSDIKKQYCDCFNKHPVMPPTMPAPAPPPTQPIRRQPISRWPHMPARPAPVPPPVPAPVPPPARAPTPVWPPIAPIAPPPTAPPPTAPSQPLPPYQPTQPSVPSSTPPGSIPTQSQMFINAHNSYRANTNPRATNMLPINWSSNLASGASNWASKCNFTHSQTPGVGENLYATSRRTPSANSYDPSEAVNSWGAEQKNYNYGNNTCAKGEVCGHYTQVVWGNTDQVGCAYQDCPKIDGISWPNGGTITVCQYNPPGNWVGQKPYRTD